MKELNYDEMEEEHQELLQIIRQTHGEGARDVEEVLKLRAQAPAAQLHAFFIHPTFSFRHEWLRSSLLIVDIARC